MPTRLRPLDDATVSKAWDALRSTPDPSADALRLLTKHYLAVLVQRYPGKSVEVRVPPYAVVQCREGARHTRGTPPAVVQTDPMTWIRLARGDLSWTDAVRSGQVTASGERSDLDDLLPLASLSG
ncbi:MAG: hypothetical protein GEU93_03015 [Propionibacteriales bacterium]|nr:hypothetical protein [Propionibacteriales bacterium]